MRRQAPSGCCATGCQGCYTGATPDGGPNEWGLERWKRAVDELAGRGVFHLALGGGESALLPCSAGGEQCKFLACVDSGLGNFSDGRLRMVGQ